MEKNQLVEALNNMLAQEHACAIRYATHASVVTGPYAETFEARLKEIGADEIRHAEMLRDRIVTLGGEPTMTVKNEDLKPAKDSSEILKINIAEELVAIRGYTKILESIPMSNAILFETIQDIIKDEQEHLEELQKLQTGK